MGLPLSVRRLLAFVWECRPSRLERLSRLEGEMAKLVDVVERERACRKR